MPANPEPLWTAAARRDAIECCDAAFNEKEGVIVQSVADVRRADRTVARLIEACEGFLNPDAASADHAERVAQLLDSLR